MWIKFLITDRLYHRIFSRWVLALVFVIVLSVLVTNVQGAWVYARTSGSNAQSGTVPSTPETITCGNGSQQIAFLDANSDSLDSINLDNPGDSVDIQVCADGLVLGGPDTVQIVIEHDDSIIELIDPTCAGLLSGGFTSLSAKRTSDDQASAFICSKPGGVSGTDGALLRLSVRRNDAGTETLAFRTSGTLTTALYESGSLVPVSGFDSISVQQQNPAATTTPTSVPTATPVPSAPIPPPATTATPLPSSGAGSSPPALRFAAPSVPGSFVAVPGLHSAVLTWDAPDDTSGRLIDMYTIQNLKTGEIVRLDGDTLTFTFDNLDPQFTYWFTIKASTGLGISETTGAGPLVPLDLPGSPTSVVANIDADDNSVVVSWETPDSDGGTPITGYRLTITSSSSGVIQSRETSETQFVISDLLNPGEAYSISVSAITIAGTGPAATGVPVALAPVSTSTPMPTTSVEPVLIPTVVPTAVPTFVSTAAPEADQSGELKTYEIQISEVDSNALESVLEAITGGDLEIDETVITTESSTDGITVSIPVVGLAESEDLAGSLEVQIGQLELDVTGGEGTAKITLTDNITVVGSASVVTGDNTLVVQISEPILMYTPEVIDDGSFTSAAQSLEGISVSFEVDLDVLPYEIALNTTYSADPAALKAVTGTTFALAADDELAYFVSVEKSGVTQDDLGDNTVTMNVSLLWLDQMVAQRREIAITKISDAGESFTESAECERLADQAMCTVTFSGAAGGFSVFAIYGFVNSEPQVSPQLLATAVPAAAATATVTALVSPQLLATAVPAAAATATVIAFVSPTTVSESEFTPHPISTPNPAIAPLPTKTSGNVGEEPVFGKEPDDGEDDIGGGGPSGLVIAGIVVVVLITGGSVIAVFVRRPDIPTTGLFVIALIAGSVVLITGNTSVTHTDGGPGPSDSPNPGIRRLDTGLLEDFDKLDFRYRKVGSGVRALSEVYRAGTLAERLEFTDMTDLEALDPSIDVSIWFESPDDVDLKLIGQTATVLNHVGDVVEARVPIRLAHQLSYIPSVLRVDRIVPPQISAITSEGASVHGSPAWNTIGLDGTGIKVGIIDLGFQGWSTISPSELPTPAGVRCYTSAGIFTSNLSDCENGEVHGTAVAEAVDDIAPAVAFYIANPISHLDVANTEAWLASQGVTIINFSATTMWDGPGDGTSPKSDSPLKTVDQAVTDGILWVNAAGNDAEDHWYGAYSDTNSNGYLNLSGSLEYQTILAEAVDGYIELRWEDSWGGATSDLKLYVTNSSNIIVWTSDNTQAGAGGDVPYERITNWLIAGDRIWVEHVSGPAPDWVQVRVSGLGLSNPTPSRSIGVPAESANPGMLAVGAASYASTSTIESFSSQGPTTDGRIKPDIVGADRGNSASYGGEFPGTSQASPHVAGLAALALQRFPTMTPAELATYLKSNATDRGTAGPDNIWGSGFAELAVPTAPTAVADFYSVDEDKVLSVSTPSGVLSNDSDDADTFTSSLVATATDGSVTLNSDGSFTYTPNTNFNGSDSFTYKDSDPWQTSSTVSVTITVDPIDDPPSGGLTSTSTDEDVDLPVSLATQDLDSEALNYTVVTPPSNGTLTLNATGQGTYDPDSNFNGADPFTFDVTDGNTTVRETLTVTVNPVNDPPVPGASSITVNEDESININLSGTDVETEPLVFSVNSQPGDGSVSINSSGSGTFTPNTDFNGIDSFIWYLDDGTDTVSATVGIVVNPIADVSGTSTSQGVSDPSDVSMSLTGTGSSTGTSNLVVGSDGAFKKHLATDTFTFTTSADGYVTRTKTSQSVTTADLSLGATELRAGDADGDGDVDSADATVLLAAFVAGLPNRANRVDGSGNTVDLNADGIVNVIDLSLWASNFNLNGPMAWDTTPTTPPLAIADFYWVYQDTQLSISGIGVLGNDHDEENDSLTTIVIDAPAHGSLTLNSNGSFTYDPTASYIGPDSFTYTASDSQTKSLKMTVKIDVRTAPAPTATPTAGTTTGTTTGS